MGDSQSDGSLRPNKETQVDVFLERSRVFWGLKRGVGKGEREIRTLSSVE